MEIEWGIYIKWFYIMFLNFIYDYKYNNILISEICCMLGIWMWVYFCRLNCFRLLVYFVLVLLVIVVFISLKFDYFWLNVYFIFVC